MKNRLDKKQDLMNPTTKEILIITLLIMCVVLSCSILMVINSNKLIREEFSLTNDVHDLRSEIFSKDKKVSGFIEIQETLNNKVNIIGSIMGLEAGSPHGLHIIKYNDILLSNKTATLLHLNPSQSKIHDCPTVDKQTQKYHEGDIGNIIANDKGIASFSIQKDVSIRAFIGRMVILLNTKDVCDPKIYKDDVKDVMAFGSLSIFKPENIFQKDIKHYNDYLIREINTFTKKDANLSSDQIENKDNNYEKSPSKQSILKRKNTDKILEAPIIVHKNLNQDNNLKPSKLTYTPDITSIHNTSNKIENKEIESLKNIDDNLEIRKKLFLQMREKILNKNKKINHK